MRHPIVPLVVLAILPFVYFAWRLGLLRKRSVLWVGVALSTVLLALEKYHSAYVGGVARRAG